MRKIIVCIIIVIISIAVIGGFRYYKWSKLPQYYKGGSKEINEKSATLYINEKIINNQNVSICYRDDYPPYPNLPFIKILENMDFYVEWSSENNAEIVYDNEEYVLNMSESTLFKKNENVNLIRPSPGSYMTYKVLDKEVILDSETLINTLHNMGMDISFKLDLNKLDVYMMYKKSDEPHSSISFHKDILLS